MQDEDNFPEEKEWDPIEEVDNFDCEDSFLEWAKENMPHIFSEEWGFTEKDCSELREFLTNVRFENEAKWLEGHDFPLYILDHNRRIEFFLQKFEQACSIAQTQSSITKAKNNRNQIAKLMERLLHSFSSSVRPHYLRLENNEDGHGHQFYNDLLKRYYEETNLIGNHILKVIDLFNRMEQLEINIAPKSTTSSFVLDVAYSYLMNIAGC